MYVESKIGDNMKKIIISFILGGLIFGSIGIYATNYLASDISYTKEGSEITNVNDALDDLYENSSKKAVVFTKFPVDMKQYTDRWAELTNADFKSGLTSCYANINFNSQVQYVFNKTSTLITAPSYNNETGELKLATSGVQEKYNSPNTAYQVNAGSQESFIVWLGTIGGK